MPPPPSPKPAFLLLLATALVRNAASQDTTNPFTWLDCPSQSPPTTGATDSTFRRNLQALLDALPAAAASTGFASLSRGEGRDRIFVRGLCRGDSGPDDCLAYLKSAVLYINGNCNSSTRAAVWYDRCSVSYADTNASIAHEDDFRYELDNAGNVSDPATFEQTYYALMRRLAARAANGSSGRMFATGEASYAPGGTMYGLVQCMRDRTAAECSRCLEKSMRRLPRCCWGHQGGVVLAYNCYLRFEIFKYYDLALDAPPPVSPGPPRSKLFRRGKKRATAVLAIALPLGVVLILFFVCGAFLQRRRIMEKRSPRVNTNREDITYVEPEQLNLPVLRAATDNFSQESKLGEGGFGEVFKGKLKDGQVIAVKRLSKNSRQGFHELKNELVVASKLKHRNLVELLGVCLQEEQLVVYEYMPNRSLDTILFDSEIKRQLDWAKRYTIICGIARGLLYLHHESRLKVIHRDLKPSNVLLDRDMNPKISDFGLARAFWQDQSRDITARPVGTLGYMSPEYAYYGQVSSKSDMFSFGVIVLEIITGRRNNSSYECADSKPLLSYVWEKWSTGSIEEIVDASLGGQYPPDEVFKCVHIGLLCVQENPSGRPDVSGVGSMLDSHSTSLQAPSKPAFFFGLGAGGNALLNGRSTQDASRNDQLARPVSKNEMTISELAPR